MSLKKKAVTSILWDLLGVFSSRGVGFFVSIFLARLLSPEDFGIVGMAMVFIGISQIFMNAGFGGALIQRENNSSLTYSSVFFFNIFLGIFLFTCFQLAAESIANFYQEPIIENLIRWLTIGIPIGALNIVQSTILRKELRFKELSLRTFLAGLISGCVGVLMAFQGYGVYALIIQNLIAVLVTTIVLWKVSEWRPRLEFSFQELRSLFSFSGYLFLGQVLNQIIQRISPLVIGKLFSPTTLGFYVRAESLNNLVKSYTASPLGKVMFPVLSKIKNDHDRFKKVFLKTIKILSFFTFLLSGILFLSGEFIILTLFGEKWLPSVFIFKILVFKIFNYPFSALIVGAFLALGKSKENFWIGNIRKVLQIIPFFVAYYYGFEPFLYSLVVVSFVASLLNNFVMSYFNEIPLKRQFINCYKFLPPFLVSILFTELIPSYSSLTVNTILSCTVFLILYFPISLFLDKTINNNFRNGFKLLRSRIRNKTR